LASLEPFPMFKDWLRELLFHDWVVYAKRPFSSAENVVRYVGMYTHRVAISNNRLISCDNGVVRFWFKNYKRLDEVEHYNEIWEEMELPADEFIRRFLHHVMPAGFNRIRYYGFLSNNNKELLARIKESLLTEEEAEHPSNEPKVYEGILCSKCGAGVLIPFLIMDGCGNILNGDAEEFVEIRRERQQSFGRESVEVMDSS
ncbi:IS91 family transposase, partial [Desulfamplus magnetovallimortis]